MPQPAKNVARPRDRAATEQAILLAAQDVLAEDGFQSFGVNAIARRAGCDKQLIYRYFGGLDGLADAIGAHLATQVTDALTALDSDDKPTSYDALMAQLTLGLLRLARENPIIQRINAWEIAAPSPLVGRMAAARGVRLGAWVQAMRGDLAPPPGIDAPAVNAVFIASVQHLALAAASSGAFAGLPLRTEADWLRVSDALRTMVTAVYGQDDTAPYA